MVRSIAGFMVKVTINYSCWHRLSQWLDSATRKQSVTQTAPLNFSASHPRCPHREPEQIAERNEDCESPIFDGGHRRGGGYYPHGQSGWNDSPVPKQPCDD